MSRPFIPGNPWLPITPDLDKRPRLFVAKGETPFVGEQLKTEDGKVYWQLIELGGYAEDRDPSYDPTHYQELEPFDGTD